MVSSVSYNNQYDMSLLYSKLSNTNSTNKNGEKSSEGISKTDLENLQLAAKNSSSQSTNSSSLIDSLIQNFQSVDSNGDGILSKSELQTYSGDQNKSNAQTQPTAGTTPQGAATQALMTGSGSASQSLGSTVSTMLKQAISAYSHNCAQNLMHKAEGLLS